MEHGTKPAEDRPDHQRRFDPERVIRAVLQVDGGRGFIIPYRKELAPFRGQRVFQDNRYVVTAAHCLPRNSIPRHLFDDRPIENLIGKLGSKPTVWAECLFVDPVADIAVLCEPDSQTYGEQCDAYHELTENVPPLRMGRVNSLNHCWLLALNGEWISCKIESSFGLNLWIEPTPHNRGGMSGSPILDDDGRAISFVSTGANSGEILEKSDHPVLMHHLPAWLARTVR